MMKFFKKEPKVTETKAPQQTDINLEIVRTYRRGEPASHRPWYDCRKHGIFTAACIVIKPPILPTPAKPTKARK